MCELKYVIFFITMAQRRGEDVRLILCTLNGFSHVIISDMIIFIKIFVFTNLDIFKYS